MSEFLSGAGAPAPADSGTGSGFATSNADVSGGSSSGSFGSSTPAPAAAGADQFYEVTINGQSQRVPLNELLKGYSRQSDYTRKTQELAERERVYQSQMQQYEAAFGELKDFLEDRDRLGQYYQALMQEAQAQQTLQDPNAYLTTQDAQMLLQQQMAQFAQQQQAQLQQVQHDFQVNQLTQQYTPQVDTKIAELKQRFPALNSPRTERMLRMEVLSRRPQSLEQANQLLEQVATEIHGDISNIFKTQGPPAPNPQLTNGIEPRGGQGPMPTPQGNFRSVKDPGLRAQIMQDLIAASQR